MTDKPTAITDKPDLNEVLLAWQSPSHPFKKRNRVFYQTVAALTFLFIVIVFFLHEYLLIGVILSITFVVYVLSTIPPMTVEHKITPIGFDNAGKLYRWEELYAFWYEKKWEYTLLVLQTRLPFPSQVRCVISSELKEKTKDIIGKYLLHLEKPPKSALDNLADWLNKKIPLEASS